MLPLRAPRIEERPVRWIIRIHASILPPGRKAASESGAYEVQPASGGEKNRLT